MHPQHPTHQIPKSTYHFSTEFEPSPLYKCVYYTIMVCIAAFVLMLIVDREIMGEDGRCEEKIEEGGRGGDEWGRFREGMSGHD